MILPTARAGIDVVSRREACPGGQLAVSDGLAVADGADEDLEHLTLRPGGGRPIERQVKLAALAHEVLGELASCHLG